MAQDIVPICLEDPAPKRKGTANLVTKVSLKSAELEIYSGIEKGILNELLKVLNAHAR